MRIRWILPLALAGCAAWALADGGGAATPAHAQETKAERAPQPPAAPAPDADPQALQADGWEAHPLTFAPATREPFPFHTPLAGTWADLAPGSPLPIGDGVATGSEKNYLSLDLDGDGKPETVLRSIEEVVTVKTRSRGAPLTVAVRVRSREAGDQARQYSWQRNTAMVGKIGKSRVALIDDNGNGAFNETGVDALAVGSRFGSPLGGLACVDGALLRLRVEANGQRLWTKAYDGPTGTIDAVSGLKAKGKLEWLVLTSGAGVFLDVAGTKAAAVPPGKYTIAMGQLGAGKMTAQIRNGTMPALDVVAGATTRPAWGMPVRFDFTYAVVNGRVELKWSDVRLVGAGKEEYHTFTPETITPKVEVREAKTGKDLRKGTMCLS
ncbi:MAG: hypothetical protein HZA54_12600 [Planctomycetes bacterium]|nr:hypothetical protein [Planctomycetota bacterium]